MNKLGLQILNKLTFCFLLLAYLSNSRIIDIAPNLSINLTYFIYPLVLLILLIINNFYNMKEAKKTIKSSIISLIIFMCLITILNLIPSNINNMETEVLFKNLFTPNTISILNFKICYPDLIFLASFLTLSFLTNYITVIIYNAIKEETYNFIAFYLSVFISLILFAISLISIDTLLINDFSFKDSISYLTSGFIVVIILSFVIFIINSIINAFKKSSH